MQRPLLSLFSRGGFTEGAALKRTVEPGLDPHDASQGVDVTQLGPDLHRNGTALALSRLP